MGFPIWGISYEQNCAICGVLCQLFHGPERTQTEAPAPQHQRHLLMCGRCIDLPRTLKAMERNHTLTELTPSKDRSFIQK
jgi:hypothetical protein